MISHKIRHELYDTWSCWCDFLSGLRLCTLSYYLLSGFNVCYAGILFVSFLSFVIFPIFPIFLSSIDVLLLFSVTFLVRLRFFKLFILIFYIFVVRDFVILQTRRTMMVGMSGTFVSKMVSFSKQRYDITNLRSN